MKIHRETEFAVGKIQTEKLNLWYGNLEIIKWIRVQEKKIENGRESEQFKKIVSSTFYFSLYNFHLIKGTQIIAS